MDHFYYGELGTPLDPGLTGPAPDALVGGTSGTAPEGDTCESPSGAPRNVPEPSDGAGPDDAAVVQPAAAPQDQPQAAVVRGGPAEADGMPVPAAAPSEVQRPSSPAVTGEQTEAGSSAGTGEPAPQEQERTCEKCGGPILDGQPAGYTRCDPCDPDGDHYDDGSGCKACAVVREVEAAYLLSFGEGPHGLVLECGECDGVVAHLKPGGGLPEVLAAAREHHAICGAAS